MRVLLVDGSSRKNGCTNAALCEVERALREEGGETEQFFIGNKEQMLCILSALFGCQGMGEFQNMLHNLSQSTIQINENTKSS